MNNKIFKTRKNFFKKNPLFSSPGFFWKVVLYFGFILMFGSFIFGFYLFKQVEKEPVLLIPDTSGQVERINPERVQKGFDVFSIREKKSIDILGSPSPVIDPSI